MRTHIRTGRLTSTTPNDAWMEPNKRRLQHGVERGIGIKQHGDQKEGQTKRRCVAKRPYDHPGSRRLAATRGRLLQVPNLDLVPEYKKWQNAEERPRNDEEQRLTKSWTLLLSQPSSPASL